MNSEIDLIYVDNHLLILNKPANLLTQPSGTDQDSLEERAKEWIKIHYNKPGNVFLNAVHRLDRPVTGVIAFGRTSKALSRLNDFVRNKEIKKTYLALVEGCPQKEKDVLENYMIHNDYRADLSEKSNPEAKIARLTYRVVEKREKMCLIEIDLDTGRYHQIRLQLSSIGCPIVGDEKYGSFHKIEKGIALHHFRLKIPHPITRELLLFEAPPPEIFNKVR